MRYHLNADNISLDDLKKRFEATDFVPSRASLMHELDSVISVLRKHNIRTLSGLRGEMKTSKRLESLSKTTGIDKNYLVLLRREVESYFPKPFPLKKFDWLPNEDIEQLQKKGIRNTADLYEAFINAGDEEEFLRATQVQRDMIEELFQLCDLTRIQWVSPTAAKMLFDAGYKSVEEVAAADPEKLCAALMDVNKGGKYFKGKIGLRDIKRLINSAGYLLK